MPNADAQEPRHDKPEPVEFPVEVAINGIKVTVTLLLRPGTTVSVEKKPDPS
jgi:hypothetical protein